MYILTKRSLYWLIAAFSAPVLLSSCGDSSGAQQQNADLQAISVNAYTVNSEDVTGTDTYPGTVVPLNEVELRPQVAGYITNIYVEDGQEVKKGERLYEIDRRKYQASYQQAQANLESSKANLEKVKKDLERYERLNEQEAIATQRLDYARTDLETARSQVASAKAQLESASTDLTYSVINAPFSGTVGISQVRVGAQVSPGQPLLNTLSSDDPISVDFVINEKEIPRFNRLMQNKSDQPDSLFTIELSDGSTYPYPGTLSTIDRAVDRQSGTINLRLSFPNPERQLIAGMTVTVKVMNQDIGQQLVIPYKAVTEQMGERYVWVIESDSVRQQNLMLGTRFGRSIVVREGLFEGQEIVVDGIQRLRQGARIQIANKQEETASSSAASK
ncbi:membrane fusion protein (multidrug efflux system) [Catalinimonas alkaloidigena]|uniref:efflux RND transporter periplasmic adaptor subunit n=1 Tax=Catalinimonas alkaloidigena TaxID=1075417 RepID=UPI0024074360|nr:efflux RND transporter periplasmic adaptor subunit [Catalinimonas alkaloidigena]MDF9796563.1 membrane fusion protein (multidrug efflux system) [Catalinimonas alkaloidigena]